MEPPRLKGLSYCRKSIKPKGTVSDQDSILYQEQVIERYCEKDNIELEARFSDIGYSGTTTERPELQRMLESLQTGELQADVLLFYTVDRLGRDLRNNVDLVLQITEHVEKIVFVSEGITNSYDYFKMFFLLKSTMAEQERIAVYNRLMHGRKAVVENRQLFRGQHKPLGYVQHKKEKLVHSSLENTSDLKELQSLLAAQFIFLGYLSGMSMRKIAQNLNRDFGLTKRGKKWDAKSISYILNNDIYAGILSGTLQNEAYHLKSPNVEPLLSQSLHSFIKKKLATEKPGRKPKDFGLPGMTFCYECLNPVVVNQENIVCNQCDEKMSYSTFVHSVRKEFGGFLWGSYKDGHLKQQLINKRSNLFIKKMGIEQQLKELRVRKVLIMDLFSDEPGTELFMLQANEREELGLKQELQSTDLFLEFLSKDEDLGTPNSPINLASSVSLLHIPYLILVDLKSNQIFLEFHPCVFAEGDKPHVKE
jgi:DNA invertase Pin-like site-specific DNA recombinase